MLHLDISQERCDGITNGNISTGVKEFFCEKKNCCFSIERTNYSGKSLMPYNVQGSFKHTTAVLRDIGLWHSQ